MKRYTVTEKQLDELKKYVESLHELSRGLSGDVAFSRPEIDRDALIYFLSSYSPLPDRIEDAKELANKIEELANDAVASAAEEFDETAVAALRESAESIERELKFWIEDVERQEADS
ncbi:hypothetical protein [Synergistes jonesii]|uniref:hypothetical protein n=1 Tax=Synergistes jonesii TaxID=2754 RepID=UPI0024305442|nr:hypothetical protein [Synergistes jonesii]